MNREGRDRNTPSNFPEAPGTRKRDRKGVVVARQNSKKDHMMRP